jgi:ribosomal protein S24E
MKNPAILAKSKNKILPRKKMKMDLGFMAMVIKI